MLLSFACLFSVVFDLALSVFGCLLVWLFLFDFVCLFICSFVFRSCLIAFLFACSLCVECVRFFLFVRYDLCWLLFAC